MSSATATNELKDWDLWGPLLLCLGLSFILTSRSNNLNIDGSAMFAAVFVIVTVGSAVVTLNTKFLGGKISFFQTLCALGYCLFPLILAGLVMAVIVGEDTTPIIKLLLSALAFVWSCWASLGFITGSVHEDRRALAVYPICLFYFFLTWLLAISV